MPIPSEEGADMVSEWIIRQVSLKTGRTNKQARESTLFTLTLFGHSSAIRLYPNGNGIYGNGTACPTTAQYTILH